MTQAQWLAVSEFRQEFRDLCKAWEAYAPQLRPLQKEAAAADTPPYPLETPVVYNRDYDRLCPEDELTLIVIGDNPGKEEQLERNRRYLVGQSGRVAEGFFRRNPELRTDFRKNVLIMNKTPVHTAKTAHLRYLLRNGGADIQALIAESQRRMAQLAAVLHQRLVESRAPGSGLPRCTAGCLPPGCIRLGAGLLPRVGCRLRLSAFFHEPLPHRPEGLPRNPPGTFP